MMSAAWPSFTAAWYSPSAATILARRSRSASASLAMARCMLSGSIISLISTAVTCVPHGSVCLSITSLICSLMLAVSARSWCQDEAIGRSKGGLSTKINATVDALGNPIGFALTPGQACDLDGADILLPQIEADIVIADKGFDADERVIDPLEKAGKSTVIPPKANRKHKRGYDKELYKERHLIENFFAKLKQFRAIATRYDKRAINFLAGIYLASIVIWLN